MDHRFFKARYDGYCARCDERIHEGDWVAYDADGNLLHKACIEEDDE